MNILYISICAQYPYVRKPAVLYRCMSILSIRLVTFYRLQNILFLNNIYLSTVSFCPKTPPPSQQTTEIQRHYRWSEIMNSSKCHLSYLAKCDIIIIGVGGVEGIIIFLYFVHILWRLYYICSSNLHSNKRFIVELKKLHLISEKIEKFITGSSLS